MSDATVSEKDVRSFQVDYLKLLTTLSTGAILIIVAFLDKVFKSPQWVVLIAVSLGGFFSLCPGVSHLHGAPCRGRGGDNRCRVLSLG